MIVIELEPESRDVIRRDVIGCSACGENHLCMGFRPRAKVDELPSFPFVGKCPTNGEPVFMKFVELKDEPA